LILDFCNRFKVAAARVLTRRDAFVARSRYFEALQAVGS
jgi:hypothetical protein